MIAKSIAIKERGGKSDGDAVKAIGLTSRGLRRVRKSRTESARKGRHRGAEVSRGHSVCWAAPRSGDFKSHWRSGKERHIQKWANASLAGVSG